MNRRELLKMSALLLGGAASASVVRALVTTGPLTTGTTATVFSGEQEVTIRLLSDMIIPPTDTPGAVAAGVPNFIATIVSEWYTERERQVFFKGLEELDAFSLTQEFKPFHEASDAARLEALRDQERIAQSYQPPPGGRLTAKPEADEDAPFFKKLKELVVLGYYTSEVGAKQELIYLPMPGYFDGNYDFSKVGRQWITN